MKKYSPLPTTNLGDKDAWPFWDGCDEIVVRVCSYKDDCKTPASFQAIARGRDRTKVWGVGVRSNPVSAIEAAIETFFAPKAADLDNAKIGSEEQALRLRKERGEAVETPEPSIEDLLG